MRVKVCGITRLEDALLAEALGASAVGFVLAPSRRRVSPEMAREIGLALGPLILRVGVFVDEPPETVLKQMDWGRLQVAQLHGNEPPEWALQIRKHYPVIKAFRLKGPADPQWAFYPAEALLLDGPKPGSGQPWPRDWAPPLLSQGARIILAGGLNPENVEEALALNPYGLDVSSGVEDAPGLKSRVKMEAFFSRLKKAGWR
ncbi:MAG: phosphoribosylanthranilate isomerase [Thermaceae bacterium]